MMPARRPPRTEHSERIHVALVGVMGAGKTTVGKVVAEKYGAPFVDLDELICSRAGKTSQERFRDHGEVGFRAQGSGSFLELLQSKKTFVIALGGGTFVDSAMRSWVQRVAKTVYLKVSPEQLSERFAVELRGTISGDLSGQRIQQFQLFG